MKIETKFNIGEKVHVLCRVSDWHYAGNEIEEVEGFSIDADGIKYKTSYCVRQGDNMFRTIAAADAECFRRNKERDRVKVKLVEHKTENTRQQEYIQGMKSDLNYLSSNLASATELLNKLEKLSKK